MTTEEMLDGLEDLCRGMIPVGGCKCRDCQRQVNVAAAIQAALAERDELKANSEKMGISLGQYEAQIERLQAWKDGVIKARKLLSDNSDKRLDKFVRRAKMLLDNYRDADVLDFVRDLAAEKVEPRKVDREWFYQKAGELSGTFFATDFPESAAEWLKKVLHELGIEVEP